MPYDVLLMNKKDFLDRLNQIAEKVKSFRFIESKRVTVESSLTGFVVDMDSEIVIECLVWVHLLDMKKYEEVIDGIHSALKEG